MKVVEKTVSAGGREVFDLDEFLSRPLAGTTELMGKPPLINRITRQEWERSSRRIADRHVRSEGE